MHPNTGYFRFRCRVFGLFLYLQFQPVMASFEPTFTDQVGSNPIAVWQWQAQQTAAPGIPTSIHSASVAKRRKRRSARTAVQLSRGHETRASAADTKGQRSLASGAPQQQPLFAFQDESIQLPHGQECVERSLA
jgi:hypothetical protein